MKEKPFTARELIEERDAVAELLGRSVFDLHLYYPSETIALIVESRIVNRRARDREKKRDFQKRVLGRKRSNAKK